MTHSRSTHSFRSTRPTRLRLVHLASLFALAGIAAGAAQAQSSSGPSNWYMVPHASAMDPDSEWNVDDKKLGPGPQGRQGAHAEH